MFRLNSRLCGLLFLVSVSSVLVPISAHAQVINSNQATVTLNATLAETLSISATPANVNFTLVSGGPALGSAPVVITSNWLLKSTRSAVNLYGWFTTPSAALTDGLSPVTNIASSLVYGLVSTGSPTSYTAFTASPALGTAGGGLQLYTQAITNTNRASTRTDNLLLKIDLTSLPQFPAGTYTGTLTLQAQSL